MNGTYTFQLIFIFILVGLLINIIYDYYETNIPTIVNNNYILINGSNKFSNNTNVIKWIDTHSVYNGFKNNFPPFLISFPASGNTFTRMILEYTTLYWTGSVYGRRPHCNKINYSVPPLHFHQCADSSVIVIKLHPMYWENQHLDDIIHMNFKFTNYSKETKPFILWQSFQRRLNKYNENISAIFLLRDIFKSCWSYFQFMHASMYDAEITQKYVNYSNTGALNHISSFIMSRDRFKSQLLANWSQFSQKCSFNWLNEFNWIHKFQETNKTILIVEFEKLFHVKYRQSEMMKILQFLFNEFYLETHKHIMLTRLQQTMDNISNMKRAELMYRVKNRLNRITEKDAYSILSDSYICQMLNNAQKQSILKVNSPREVNCSFDL